MDAQPKCTSCIDGRLVNKFKKLQSYISSMISDENKHTVATLPRDVCLKQHWTLT